MTMREICERAPVVPVLTVEDAALARPMGETLVEAGLPALEVTLRTPAALDAIRAMSAIEGGIVGAGTLLTPEDVRAAKAAGARFGVSPGYTPELLDAAEAEGLPMLPGAASPSEVMALLARGYEVMKLFPAVPIGGHALLKALAGPFPTVRFCPTGGITAQNARDYLSLPNVVCVGGSWIASADLVRAREWAEIGNRARQALALGAA